MKKLILLFVGVTIVTVFNSCQQECDEWYERDGNECVEVRQKFLGTYVGTLTSGGQTQNSMTTLSSNGNVQRITWDGSQYLELTGDNTVSIPLQNVYDQNQTYSIEGSGSLNGSQLVLNFVITYQGQTTVANFTGTK